ncbi:MAG: TMEM175 family protein [Actinomycetota bacterium]
MTTARLGTFADGVFAIAATLLILNVDTAIPEGSGELAHRLLEAWPAYVGYAVSFLTIGIIWVNHHTVMSLVERADRRFLFATVLFLMCVAFIPFPTRLLAEHLREEGARAAALLYGITLTTTAVMFSVVWFSASVGRRLLRADADPRTVSGITRSYLPGPWIYLGATLVALVSPTASAILYAAIAVFYVVESSIFGRAAREAG